MPDKTLSQTLKELRLSLGISQAELAKRVGMSRASITNIEAGNQTLTEHTLFAIADALGFAVSVHFKPKGESTHET